MIGPAVISRLGSFNHDTYEVLCNSLVSHSAQTAASCTTSPMAFTSATPLVRNIVMLQAQYGITNSANSDTVTGWVDATGPTWSTPSAADIPRIKAIRIAVISRSIEPARTNVTTACTNISDVANTGPCTFQDADSPVVNLSSISMPSGKTWQNYRYRVYTSIIPLRNVLWSY